MSSGYILHDSQRFQLMIERLCQHLVENHGDFSASCLVGIQAGGVQLGDRLQQRLESITGQSILYGKLDITFYRDDFRTRLKPLQAYPTEMDFLVEDKRVILLDDVLYTGRTTVSAITALNHYGRPKEVELLVLVDRRFKRVVPIQADYYGIQIDTLQEEYVEVTWAEKEGKDQIILHDKQQS